MDCWQQLGITSDADKKTIKLAYAKKLKQTRPDDDPEGFKVLHEAYQSALYWQERYAEEALADEYNNWGDDEEADTTAPATALSEALAVDAPTTALSLDKPLSLTLTLDNTSSTEPLTTIANTVNAEKYEVLSSVVGFEHPSLEEHLAEPLLEEVLFPAIEQASSLVEINAPEQVFTLAAPNHAEPPAKPALIDDLDDEQIQQSLTDDWEQVMERVQSLLKSKQGGKQVLDWHFLEKVPSMVDLEFRSRLGDKLFDLIAEANQLSLQHKVLRFGSAALNYLNGLFQWEYYWREYEQRFGGAMVNAVLPYITDSQLIRANATSASKSKSKNIQSVGEFMYPRRILAFILDMAVAFGLMLLGDRVLVQFTHEAGLILFFAYFLLLMPLMESSLYKHHASFGKRLMTLQVVGHDGLALPWYQSFWRTLMMALSLALFKVTVWVNIYTARRHNALVQDLLSRSYVVERRK